MTCSAPVTKPWDPATAVTQAGRSSALPASTPYTREELAFADAYAREQMQDATYRGFQ